MNITHVAACAALAVVFATGAGLAQAQKDPTGKQDLGVDISGAGTTPADNKKFVEGQPTEDQARIKEACLVFVTEPDAHAPEVIAFCQNANQAAQ